MTVNNVSIGDIFEEPGSGKYICTVVDFNMVTNDKGGIIRHECLAVKTVLGKKVRFAVPFETVVRNRFVKNNKI